MTGFKTVGFQIETTNTATTSQVDNGTSQMGAGVRGVGHRAHQHARERHDLHHQRPVPEHPHAATTTDAQVGLSAAGCSNHENPNFQPSGVATLAGGQVAPIQPPNDGFFEAVTFIGAVPPAPADNWMTRMDVVPAAVRRICRRCVAAVIVTAACSTSAPAEPTRATAAPLSNTFESADALARSLLDALSQTAISRGCARCRCPKLNFAITCGPSFPPAVPNATCRSNTPGDR